MSAAVLRRKTVRIPVIGPMVKGAEVATVPVTMPAAPWEPETAIERPSGRVGRSGSGLSAKIRKGGASHV